jgi:DNA-binding beta-propeller fold protein YncE
MKICVLSVYLIFASFLSAPAQTIAPLTLERTITLPGVTGKFDHFAMDETGGRLFAASGGNHAVVVIDLATAKILQSLPDIGKPHGLAWIAETKQLFVADGSGAVLDVFEGSPLKLLKSIKLSEDADDLAYDSTDKVLYVGHGGTDAANPASVAAVDVEKLTIIGTLPLAAHPEGIEFDSTGDRVFANVSDTGEIAVINGKTHSIVSTWPLNDEKGNTPLAYDAADGLLLVGCRTPAKLLIINARTGKEISSIASDTGADDLFYEPSSHRAYLITGSGVVDTYKVSSDGKVNALGTTKTAAGAKTGLLVPSQGVLYVGVPGSSSPSDVLVYATSSK